MNRTLGARLAKLETVRAPRQQFIWADGRTPQQVADEMTRRVAAGEASEIDALVLITWATGDARMHEQWLADAGSEARRNDSCKS